MERDRMEAFSDGVLAIIITIMVLNLHIPAGNTFKDFMTEMPKIGIYAMSFAYVGAYWNSHHHTLHTVTMVTGAILWANLLFLFFISLLPFAAAWFGQNLFDPVPTFVYGLVLFLTAISFFLLRLAIVRCDECSHILREAMENDRRGKFTGIIYIIALGLSFCAPRVAVALHTMLLILWFIPDKNIEQAIYSADREKNGE